MGWKNRVLLLTGTGGFPLTIMTAPALVLTQPPIQWILGDCFPGGKGGWSMMLATRLHFMLRLKMINIVKRESNKYVQSIFVLFHFMALCSAQDQLHLTLAIFLFILFHCIVPAQPLFILCCDFNSF
jgi:hypothetical protein